MKRATAIRRWPEERLAAELVKANRRAAMLAEEVNRRAQEYYKRMRRECATAEAKVKARDVETGFRLGHRGVTRGR